MHHAGCGRLRSRSGVEDCRVWGYGSSPLTSPTLGDTFALYVGRKLRWPWSRGRGSTSTAASTTTDEPTLLAGYNVSFQSNHPETGLSAVAPKTTWQLFASNRTLEL